MFWIKLNNYELQQELSRTKYGFILNTLRLKQAWTVYPERICLS